MSSKSRQKQITHRQETNVTWNYPVPPPHLLEQYKNTSPEIIDTFLKEWKLEAEHRRKCDEQIISQKNLELSNQEIDIKETHKNNRIAMLLAFSTIIFLVIVSVVLLFYGHKIEALTAFIATLALFWFNKKEPKPKN
ncbi:MAG: hypothetical protein JNL11_17445 [Bdellovibrionaceae bacterium]|nr:hypothetical protein [Pseudobdellovibrionaceae bacterium]